MGAMRTILIAAVAAAALAAGPSHAEAAIGCRTSAGPNGVPGNVSVGGVCRIDVPVTQTTVATVRLTPGAGFTGVLTAKLTGGDYGGVSVTGIYVAGELVQGMDSTATTLIAAPDAAWRLTVTAGEPQAMSTYLFPPLPQQVSIPGVAAGEFGADVVMGEGEPAK